jgi:GNAT superfamily N-acetyltransferase
MQGGPWMDPTALRSYWKHIDRLSIIPLVAEIDGKIVGHLDVLFSEELLLGQFLYLDVLFVHKAFRRRGVAGVLIQQAENLATLRQVDVMLVTPQAYEGPAGLTYRKYGFKKYLETFNLELSIKSLELSSEITIDTIPQTQKTPIKTHHMLCGWNNISKKMWDYSINANREFLNTFSVRHSTCSSLINRKQYFFYVRNDFFSEKGSLNFWAPSPLNQNEIEVMFNEVKTSATRLGIQTLKTKTLERYVSTLENTGFTKKSKGEPYLIKKIGEKHS